MSRILFSISWFSVSSSLLVACYFLFGSTRWMSVLLLVLGAVVAWWLVQKVSAPHDIHEPARQDLLDRGTWFFEILCVLGALVPMVLLRTDAAVASPWHTPVLVFAAVSIYGAVTWYLLQREGREGRVALFMHGLATFGLAQYVFMQGYGFDPVVHEAALREVVAHGQVLPLQFMYSTYYAVLSAIHFVTHIPVAWLNTWVVPVGAAAVQSIVAPWALQMYWSVNATTSRRAALLLSGVSVPVFILSTPWSMSVLLLLVVVLISPAFAPPLGALHGVVGWLVLVIVLLHPLAGVPIAAAIVGAVLMQRRPAYAMGAAAVLSSVALVGMFGLLRIRAGVPFFEPAMSLVDAVVCILNTYGVRVLFLVSLFLLLRRTRVWIPEISRRIIAGLVGGVLVSSLILLTVMPAPNVSRIDQFEYAWRLLWMSLVVLAPVGAVAIARWRDRRGYWIVCAVTLMMSWYAMYPAPWSMQYVVSGADMRIARVIPAGVVLSDQVFAQAGLKVEGFPSRYPVDAGSEASRRSEVMLHRSVAEAIQGLEHPVVVVHAYWYRAKEIVHEARAAGLVLLAEEGVVSVYGVVNAAPVR